MSLLKESPVPGYSRRYLCHTILNFGDESINEWNLCQNEHALHSMDLSMDVFESFWSMENAPVLFPSYSPLLWSEYLFTQERSVVQNLSHTVKTRIKEHVFWGFRLILSLHIGCFLQNQPENVLKVFLKLFLN